MQLFAKDRDEVVVNALTASKGVDYWCLECGDVVRRRGGQHRQPHFYHLKPKGMCRQSGKGMPHLQVQLLLSRELPDGDVVLEQPFPTIRRIADIAWLSRQIVFEVQCSGITSDEVRARVEDYASVGYQVVWILHDRQFNRRIVSSAEGMLMRGIPYYFTNMDALGSGEIYDQLDKVDGWRRQKLLTHLRVNLTEPITLRGSLLKRHPLIAARLKSWPLYFAGDVLDRYFRVEIVLPMVPDAQAKESPLWQAIKRFYKTGFQALLEMCCNP